MKNILLLLVISFFVGKNCEAQNLVPNLSFEDTVACPNSVDQVFNSNGWNSFGNSPDYFNSCSHDTLSGIILAGVPNNFAGYEFAINGSAYCGLYTFEVGGYREFLGRALSNSLQSGNKYFVSVKVSLADSSRFATNNLGVLFSTVAYSAMTPAPMNNHPQIFSPQIISDTSNWITISGSFISDSAYQYIIIGNFFTDSASNITSVQSPNQLFMASYYYIDDVCVSPDSLECDLNPEGIYNLKETKASINLYPNPVSEQLTVNCEQVASRIEISDALGRVKSCEFKVQRPFTQIDIHSLPSGIYFIKVYFGDGTMEVKKLVRE